MKISTLIKNEELDTLLKELYILSVDELEVLLIIGELSIRRRETLASRATIATSALSIPAGSISATFSYMRKTLVVAVTQEGHVQIALTNTLENITFNQEQITEEA